MCAKFTGEGLHIIAMRGIHDAGMVKQIVAAAQDTDIVLFEYLGLTSQKAKYERVMNRWSDNPKSITAKDEAFATKVNNPMFKIAWQLRGKGILFCCVDETYADEEALNAAKAASPVPTNALDLLRHRNLEKYYRDFDAYLRTHEDWLTRRDKLVAHQAAKIINGARERHWKADEVMIVQGYNHLIMPILQRIYPNASIKEQFYNTSSLNDAVPYHMQLGLASRCNRDQQSSRSLMDRHALTIFAMTPTLNDTTQPGFTFDMFSEQGSTNETLIKYRGFVKEAAKLSDAEAHELVEEMLQLAKKS